MGTSIKNNFNETSESVKQNSLSPSCPLCSSEMEERLGKYGYFWGCKKFKTKKCRGTVDISQKAFEFEFIDYDEFVKNNPTQYLLDIIEKENIPLYVKELKDILDGKEIVKGTILERNIEGKISGVFDYLNKKGLCFEMSKLAYWFYCIEGDLQGKFDFWLNRKPSTEFRDERYIKKSLINYWNETPLNFYSFHSEELEIGKWIGEFGGYKIDIVCKDILTDELIFMEVKGFKQKAIAAMPQLVNYIRYYNNQVNNTRKVKKSYIVSRGYPRGVFDNDLPFEIGLIGYVVEGDKISFIPWKII
jgi:ssDNA-binding Zn-finger/Zn-ribbon topoisomerase 1